MNNLDSASWNELLDALARGAIAPEQVHTAIVRLGKPLDKDRIQIAKHVVSRYLEHPDPWVRHEALWFLGSWGRLREFEPAIIRALRSDPVDDNREFAAACLGILEFGQNEPHVLKALRESVLNPGEAESVRLTSYAAMLEVTGVNIGKKDLSDFQMGRKLISDINWKWVEDTANQRSGTK